MQTRSSAARRLREDSCNFSALIEVYRYILGQCKNYNVQVNKPKDIESFLNSLGEIRTQKKKAANLLFEEIEHDVIDKERFVIEQIEKIKEMNDSYQTMKDYEVVLRSVQFIMKQMNTGQNVSASMHGGLNINDTERGSTVGQSFHGEENKLEVPLMRDD